MNQDEGFIFEVLDKTSHSRSGFDCSVRELNEFIVKYASQQQGKHLNIVYVAVPKEHYLPKPILGYYTLNASSLSFRSLPEDIGKNLPINYPISAIKIRRLARDLQKTKAGFGEQILGDALYRILKLSREIGVFAVDLDAKNHHIKEFYQKYGFFELQDNPLGLILPIKTLEKTLDKTVLTKQLFAVDV